MQKCDAKLRPKSNIARHTAASSLAVVPCTDRPAAPMCMSPLVPSSEYSLADVRITMAELLRLERDTSIRKTASWFRGLALTTLVAGSIVVISVCAWVCGGVCECVEGAGVHT